MNGTVEFDPDSAINFAEFMAKRYDALEPWTKAKSEEYVPPISVFGGLSDGQASVSDIEYEFEYLTVEEFEAKAGITLDKASDPGGLTDAGHGWGGDVAEVAGEVIDYVPLVGPWAGEVSGINSKTSDWIQYYQARGVSGETGKIVMPGEGQEAAPWAKPLHDDWKQAVENRTQEVDNTRSEIATMLELLNGAAEHYMNTDLENAAGIDLADFKELALYHAILLKAERVDKTCPNRASGQPLRVTCSILAQLTILSRRQFRVLTNLATS